MTLYTGQIFSRVLIIAALIGGMFALRGAAPARANAGYPGWSTSAPNFGTSVFIFTPVMPLSQIQATVDEVSSMQVSNQFGTQRYALLFEPGTYGSAAYGSGISGLSSSGATASISRRPSHRGGTRRLGLAATQAARPAERGDHHGGGAHPPRHDTRHGRSRRLPRRRSRCESGSSRRS